MKIGEAIAASKSFGHPGRVYLRWDERSFSPGDQLPPSRRWVDGEPTTRLYRGTCVLDPTAPLNPSWDYRQSYRGTCYLVTGTRPRRGRDRGEMILHDVVVVALL